MTKNTQKKITSAISAFSEAGKKLDVFIGGRTKAVILAELNEYSKEVLKPLKTERGVKTLAELPEYNAFTSFKAAVLMRFTPKRVAPKKVSEKPTKPDETGKVELETSAPCELNEEEALNKLRFAASVLLTRFEWTGEQLAAQMAKTADQVKATEKM